MPSGSRGSSAPRAGASTLALYDFDLLQPTAKIVAGAVVEAEKRGVAVRLAFNVDSEKPPPVFPPPRGEPSLIDGLDVPTKPIPGIPDLMHHKFAIRDRQTVWTGSTNWTDDSWTRCENVIVIVGSPEVAAAYTKDFEQLWTTGSVEQSGFVDPDPIDVDGREVRTWFSPGHGEALATRIAHRIKRSRRRIRVCSPVLTSGPILGALAECVSDGKVDVTGVCDGTQMRGVYHQWDLKRSAGISNKRSWGSAPKGERMKKERVVGVGRVSRVGERDTATLEHQEERVREGAAREGAELVAFFPEENVSGGAPLERRTGLRSAVEMIEEGQAEILSVAYFDRLCRSIRVKDEVVTRVEDAGGRVVTLDQGRSRTGLPPSGSRRRRPPPSRSTSAAT